MLFEVVLVYPLAYPSESQFATNRLQNAIFLFIHTASLSFLSVMSLCTFVPQAVFFSCAWVEVLRPTSNHLDNRISLHREPPVNDPVRRTGHRFVSSLASVFAHQLFPFPPRCRMNWLIPPCWAETTRYYQLGPANRPYIIELTFTPVWKNGGLG